jgi:hypothetical protein
LPIKYQVWFNIVLVIEDKDHKINVKQIKREFNSYLFKSKEISFIESKLLNRVSRKGDVVFANALGSLDVPKMVSIIKRYHTIELSGEDLIKKYPHFRLPKRNLVTGECQGGAFRHTFDVDAGVKPIVDAINTIKYVRTFSSCDGHGERCLYVSWRVRKHSAEPIALKIIDEAFNEVYPKYNFPLGGPFKVQYCCGYMDLSKLYKKIGLYFIISISLFLSLSTSKFI